MSKHNLPLRAANLIHALDGLDAAKASGVVEAVAAAQAAHHAAKAAFDAATAASSRLWGHPGALKSELGAPKGVPTSTVVLSFDKAWG